MMVYLAGVSIFHVCYLHMMQEMVTASTFGYVPRPEFADSGPEINVTSYLSQTSRIPCRVRNLGNKKVSWIRGRDLQVISSARTKFISDIRISILPGAGSKRFVKRGANERLSQSYGSQVYYVDQGNPVVMNNPIHDETSSIVSPHHLLPSHTTYRQRMKRSLSKFGQGSKTTWSIRTKKTNILNNSDFPGIPHHYKLFKDDVRQLNNPFALSHSKKHRKRIAKFNLKSTDGFTDLSLDYTNDYFADEAPSSPVQKNDSIPRSMLKPYSTVFPPKTTLLHGLHSKKSFRDYNEISRYETFTSKEPKQIQESKNPIFIRPLGSTKDLNEDLKHEHIQLPYNYLDAYWEPEDFTLQIKYTRLKDAGTYLCQINTEPRMTQVVHLRVVEMIAQIEGPKVLFVKEGSPVVLTCNVTHGDELPGFIFWYKDDHLVEYDKTNGRIEVDMTINSESKLILKEADRTDSANYTCAPSGGKPDGVILTVIAEKKPEAVQQSDGSSRRGGLDSHPSLSLLLPSIIIALMKQSLLERGEYLNT